MTRGASHDILIVANALSVASGGVALKRIRLLPMGKFTLRDGRGTYEVRDLAHAQAIVAATQHSAGAQRLPIDYDHQSVFGAKDGVGGQAPASGWMQSFEADQEGVWANVKWTRKATAAIQDEEYLYLSPYFSVDNRTGLVRRLINAALTNTPAIDDLTKLAANLKLHQPEETEMSLTAIAAALGLDATATESQIIAASTALTSQVAGLRAALGVGATDDLVAAAATLKSAAPVAADQMVVPKTLWDTTQARLAKIEGDTVAASVAQGLLDMKITPAQEAWALEYGKRDPDGLALFLKNATPIAAAADVGAGTGKTASTVLSDEELVAASSAGLTAQEFLAEKALAATNTTKGA